MLDKAADTLLTQGGIWAALFIFTFAVGAAVAVYLMKALRECWAGREALTKSVVEVITALNVATAAQTVENRARTRAAEAAAIQQAALVEVIGNMRADVRESNNRITTLTTDLARRRA